MIQLEWTLKKFEELNPYELYNLLKLRSEIFVVEQQCIFLDMDDKDQKCFHLLGHYDNELVVYARILHPGLAYKEMSIGRVVGSNKHRGMGFGRALMSKAIETAYDIYGRQNIRIGAQLYLQSFYSSLGFEPQGDIYIEDGIQHIEMLKH